MSRPYQTYRIIKSFEAKELKKRNFLVKFADFFSGFFGSTSFLVLNAIFFTFWISMNMGMLTPYGLKVVDAFPFPMLTTIVSLEAIFLTIIVLISQNRQSYISTLREELHLQVNLIAEKEITKILKLLHELHKHHKIVTSDPELEDMIKDLDASYIERQLSAQLSPVTISPTQKVVQTVSEPLKKVTAEVTKTLSQTDK